MIQRYTIQSLEKSNAPLCPTRYNWLLKKSNGAYIRSNSFEEGMRTYTPGEKVAGILFRDKVYVLGESYFKALYLIIPLIFISIICMKIFEQPFWNYVVGFSLLSFLHYLLFYYYNSYKTRQALEDNGQETKAKIIAVVYSNEDYKPLVEYTYEGETYRFWSRSQIFFYQKKEDIKYRNAHGTKVIKLDQTQPYSIYLLPQHPYIAKDKTSVEKPHFGCLLNVFFLALLLLYLFWDMLWMTVRSWLN